MGKARVAALGLVAALVAPAGAQEPPKPLRYDLAVDGAVTGAAIAGVLTLGLLQPDLAPTQCRWCVPGRLDRSVAESLVWSNPGAADTWSTVLADGAIPAGMIAFGLLSAGSAGDWGAGGVDALLIAEAASISALLNQGVKLLAARQRPYAYFGRPPPGEPASEQNLSFYSGHTSFSFATATAAGTVFLLRGYRGAGIALGAGLAVATFVGYLRIAADMHYLSDVLVGAAVGGLVGWAVPWIFHRAPDPSPQPGALRMAPGGIAIAF